MSQTPGCHLDAHNSDIALSVLYNTLRTALIANVNFNIRLTVAN